MIVSYLPLLNTIIAGSYWFVRFLFYLVSNIVCLTACD